MEVDRVRALYASMPERLDRARRDFGRPLTLAEKILWNTSKRCTP